MFLNSRLVIIGGVALLVIVGGIITLIFTATGNAPNGTNQTTNPNTPPPPEPASPPVAGVPEPDTHEEHPTENHRTTGLLNAALLTNNFTLSQASFINMKVVEHAQQQLDKDVVQIAGDTITPRGGEAFGFTVNDEQEALFYVIATKQPDGNVKVDIY